ncbi:putative bifunctional nicotinamidase/pyrazinamidase [Paratrimastix pyriformis]|uniref:nicotinamidase n=1 Tax=Paratrimastix pyriformis TaxID=342808 RepID=A0ABQ8V023_9EUKA|nr:putative bifunctional nicotinamidase/pyrazinamidase [Paratrimastix pyriformis]
MTQRRALLVIDVQYDFLAGGSLAVPAGNEIIPEINAFHERVPFDLVVFSMDWHPANHCSFVTNNPGATVFTPHQLPSGPQMMWPAHCVQNTHGAQLHADLRRKPEHMDVRKGQDPHVDSYSAFFDNNHAVKTPLDDILISHGITDVYVCGLATDYCVAYTSMDSRFLGYNTYMIEDLSRGISPACIEKAKREMQEKGVHVVQSADIH